MKADGKTVFEGTIDEGTSKDWKAEKELKITAGNAAAVTLTYNGEDKGVLGGEGEVVEKTYALDGQSDGAENAKSAKSSKSDKK